MDKIEKKAIEICKLPEKCYACVWSWGTPDGNEWCRLCLNPEDCEGPKDGE